jgi:1-deoxy-D-xylulose-5-phosphate reductoisomerase
MAKSISILGSTGSIGVQTLEAVKNLGITVVAMSANSNIKLLAHQIKEFSPKIVSVGTRELAEELSLLVKDSKTKILYGQEGNIQVATIQDSDTVVAAIVGIAGLIPVMEAIKSGKTIALANKETLVTAGEIMMNAAYENNVKILPVDSEHSAIFQSMEGNRHQDVDKIILTASGGPFRGKTKEELEVVTLEQALKHPNWSMGSKITIDSATLMNKGLEVIEAKWLFDLKLEQIEVMVHPQSIIHSMVQYIDGSIIAQLGPPDMRLPIQYALTYPNREKNNFSRVSFMEIGKLEFIKPDVEAFPCLRLAFDALKSGGTMPAVMNGANEAAVALFLNRKIKFIDIPCIIENIMSKHIVNTKPVLDDIIYVDGWARLEVMKLF